MLPSHKHLVSGPSGYLGLLGLFARGETRLMKGWRPQEVFTIFSGR